MSFHKDLAYGEEGERLVFENFKKHGWKLVCDDGYKGYDFRMEHTKTGIVRTIEVKRDRRAQDTGNVFLEYRCRGKDSGIAVSDAEIWVFLIGDDSEMLAIFRSELKALTVGCRQVKGGDAYKSEGFLVPVESIRKQQQAREYIKAGK
jgi:hypothetical protein